MSEVALFGKWGFEDLEVGDLSLQDYIAAKPTDAVFVPHTAGRWGSKRFKKARCPIVERLVVSLMFHGRNGGKKLQAVRIVKHALEIIALQVEGNPLVFPPVATRALWGRRDVYVGLRLTPTPGSRCSSTPW